jgi:hypothetical protein
LSNLFSDDIADFFFTKIANQEEFNRDDSGESIQLRRERPLEQKLFNLEYNKDLFVTMRRDQDTSCDSDGVNENFQRLIATMLCTLITRESMQ